MKTLTPEESRRPFAPGAPIRCGDGRLWHFARPADAYRPVMDDVTIAEVQHVVRLVGTVEPAFRDVLAARETGDQAAFLLAIFRLAAARLRACHQIGDAQLADVLTIPGDRLDSFATEIVRSTLDQLPPDDGPIPLADVEPSASSPDDPGTKGPVN